jgi:uncharacterized protein
MSRPVPPGQPRPAAPPSPAAGLVVHLARFGRALRGRGVGVSLSDEADGLAALALIDLGDRDEVRRALRAALKIRPHDRPAFEELFALLWSARPPAGGAEDAPRQEPAPPPARREEPAAPEPSPRPRPAERPWQAPALPPRLATSAALPGPAAGAPQPPAGEGPEPGYSPEAALRRKPFEECSAADLEAMERLLARLALRLATRPSRRRVPAPGRAGEADLRRSFRRAVAHGGELLELARRKRAIERPRLVALCDTSGSMDPHARFLLAFVLAVRRAARGGEVFAFNTALVRLTPWLGGLRPGGWLLPGRLERTLARLGAAVPDWSGGTRIGECLAEFAARWLDELVDGRTVVLVLSDGLDRGDVRPLAAALRAIRARARRVIWLNPLAGDSRYQPTARAMAAALPHLDRLLPAHDLESLARLLPLLAA